MELVAEVLACTSTWLTIARGKKFNGFCKSHVRKLWIACEDSGREWLQKPLKNMLTTASIFFLAD
jgi:hypothetical protein